MNRNCVLIVDEDVKILNELQRQLGKEYNVTAMTDSSGAIDLLSKDNSSFAVAIIDYKMPVINGIEFCSLAKELAPDMPCVLLFGQLDVPALNVAAKHTHVASVLGKPCATSILTSTVNQMVKHYNESQITRRKVDAWANDLEKIEQASLDSLCALSFTIASKNNKLAAHGRMTGNLAKAIAEEMNLPKNQRDCLWWSGVVHEIGQTLAGKSDDVTMDGERYEKFLRKSYLATRALSLSWPVAEIIKQHRERLDGSGFPSGLRSPKIEMLSRILGLADYLISSAQTGDAIDIHRIDQAIENIFENTAEQFDEEIVDICADLVTRENFMQIIHPVYS